MWIKPHIEINVLWYLVTILCNVTVPTSFWCMFVCVHSHVLMTMTVFD